MKKASPTICNSRAPRSTVALAVLDGDTSAAIQLLRYAVEFKNPRLIAITGAPIPCHLRVAGIEYLVFANGRISGDPLAH